MPMISLSKKRRQVMAKKGLREAEAGKEEYWKEHIRECSRRGNSQAE